VAYWCLTYEKGDAIVKSQVPQGRHVAAVCALRKRGKTRGGISPSFGGAHTAIPFQKEVNVPSLRDWDWIHLKSKMIPPSFSSWHFLLTSLFTLKSSWFWT